MRTSKNGLFLCSRGAPKNPGRSVTKARVYEFPASKRLQLTLPGKVFMAIVYLLFALYTGIVIKDLAEGKEPPVLDTGGAPRPCAPPSHGIWPDCGRPAQE